MLLVRRPSSTSSNLVRTSPLSQPLVSMLKLCNTRTLALPSGMSGVRTRIIIIKIFTDRFCFSHPDPSIVETLLPEHAGTYLCCRQQRS
ncbi:hypothetical protein HID58_053869 [Brassica napus]|uniref:Uncharacterized protein n=1 Tax=Brassica napus TaxID=3708 RepID=A0ABQ8AFY7_BRANA|nr:hypothetical protein HID58_053869 [Brassica napus]